MKLTKDEHVEEIYALLKEQGCMDQQGRIRRWTPQAQTVLELCGHTSIDPDQCECCN